MGRAAQPPFPPPVGHTGRHTHLLHTAQAARVGRVMATEGRHAGLEPTSGRPGVTEPQASPTFARHRCNSKSRSRLAPKLPYKTMKVPENAPSAQCSPCLQEFKQNEATSAIITQVHARVAPRCSGIPRGTCPQPSCSMLCCSPRGFAREYVRCAGRCHQPRADRWQRLPQARQRSAADPSRSCWLIIRHYHAAP